MNASIQASAPVQTNASTDTPWNTAVAPATSSIMFSSARTLAPHVILLRFAALNLIAFALLAAAWANGLVDKVVTADGTRLSLLIFVVFLGGLTLCAVRIHQVSRDVSGLDPASRKSESVTFRYVCAMHQTAEKDRANLTGGMRMDLSQRIVLVRYIANALVLLGLIGTVVGFIIALSGIDPEGAQDVSAIAPMVSTLIAGMSTALYTTLVGSVLNLWLMANYQILAHGTVQLISGLLSLPAPTGVTPEA